ncbi:GDSL esterase/lipase APG isoform X1 [Musa acuminata AAA Group]|uniref:GDSL esterase/lipase APG isoform X1 n=1 Tax=Musa acuminata AAA Group TaxID=214697 RepID=UPI0031D48453
MAKSGNSTVGALLALALFLLRPIGGNAQASSALVPAIITFGDSTVDVGNNDYLKTIFKADFPPYGRDFKNHKPTGRFCNGKLATDITADTLGFSSYPSAYLSPEASGKNLLIGANFASAASGYYDDTAYLYHAIPLSQQLEFYKEYQHKLSRVAGTSKASSIISGALYIVSTGASDFVQNYYINPHLYETRSPDQFSSFLVHIFCNFVKDLYGLGARKIGVTSLPPLGCLPASITLFGHGSNECVRRLNSDAQNFNRKLNTAADSLAKQLPNLKIAIFDIYKPLHDLATLPSDFGRSAFTFPHRFRRSHSCTLRILRGQERLLRDGNSGDDIVSVQSAFGRDMRQCHWLCVLGQRPSIGIGKPSACRFPHFSGHQPYSVRKGRVRDAAVHVCVCLLFQ